MRILIVGSGLIGLTTAWSLRLRGHEVTVLDREEGPGLGASFANGSLLTPSMSDPWNAPGSWRVLLASIGGSDSAMQLRLRAVPALVGWGIRFLRNSSIAAHGRNSLSNLRLSLFSLQALESLRRQTAVKYGRGARGSLKVFRNRASLERALADSSRLVSEGLRLRALTVEQTIGLEPALLPVADRLAGAIHYSDDESGDAYQFCAGLAEELRRQGVEFRFRAPVSSIEVSSDRLVAVVSGSECIQADRFVIAAGSYSARLLKQAGIHVPVAPVKGYSITIPCENDHQLLHIPLIDDGLHAVVVPMDGAIRVAGTAEFTGFDLRLDPVRVQNLLNLVRDILPRQEFDPATVKSWCGLRSMSADGVPIICGTPLSNLFVNTGHGHLGWTMAAGSGELLAQILTGEATSIEAAPFRLERFT